MRNLCSALIPCSGGCQYCFAKWDDIYTKQPLLSTVRINENIFSVLYPCCDGEFFEQDNCFSELKKILCNRSCVCVDISTKRHLKTDEISELIELDRWLKEHKKGFVKFSISISTKSRITELEPNTMNYEERISLANSLKQTNILTTLTIKPVLPFISSDEYCEIVKDFSELISYITIGGLYLNLSSAFYKKYIENKYPCIKRRVSWLDSKPEWFYIEDTEKIIKIKKFASVLGIHVFDSDEELIQSIN